jgi:hypothetical protein
MGLIQYNTKWTTIDQNEVLKLHSNHYTINDICLQLRTTEHIVNKILKLHGLKGGTKIDRLKDKYQGIVELYQQTNRLSVVAVKFDTTEALVEKVLKLHNISKREVIKELDTNEVIKYYEETHRVKLVADKFGVSNSVILKLLHKNNVRVSKIKYSDKEIIEYYLKVKTIKKVCDDLKIGDSKVSDVLKSNNVELLTFRRKEIGDVYGKLTIIEESNPKVTPSGEKKRQFILKCECGTLVNRSSTYLNKGKSWHCGCVTKERIFKREEEKRIKLENYYKRLLESQEIKKNKEKEKKEKKRTYFVGSVKGKLTILSISDDKWETRTMLCKCECGVIKEMLYRNIYGVNSCGCLVNENRSKASTIHGHSKKVDSYRRKWYDRWRSMVKRCYNDKNVRYMDYGGRGIKVCNRWLEPNGVGCENYYNDIHNILGPQPGPNYSLDRIDNDGMYEITNLQWATISEQNKNQRRYVKK